MQISLIVYVQNWNFIDLIRFMTNDYTFDKCMVSFRGSKC